VSQCQVVQRLGQDHQGHCHQQGCRQWSLMPSTSFLRNWKRRKSTRRGHHHPFERRNRQGTYLIRQNNKGGGGGEGEENIATKN
jgi:hypothetical protein